jgi:hypothetical protein
MKAVAFDAAPRAGWDAVAEASDDAWLTHRADWVDVETRFFVSANLSFALVEGDEIIAVQPLYLNTAEQGTPNGEVLVHSGIHRHTGLALSPGLSRSGRIEAQKLAMARILDLSLSHGADRVQLNAHNLAPRQRSADRDQIPYWAMGHGFHLGMGFGPQGLAPAPGFGVCNADQIVDLNQPAEALFEAVDSACRRAIRKAEKAALSFAITTSNIELERYWTLALRSASRTGEQLPLRGYYDDLAARFGPTGNMALAFASHDRRDVAALLLMIDKGAASFLAGVSEPDALAMRPNDFIHWNAILACKQMGLSAYRFGPVFPETPQDWAIARVSAFKGKFGGKGTPVIQGSLFLKPSYAAECVERAVENMRQIGRLADAPLRPSPSPAAENIAHYLRLVGVSGASTDLGSAKVLIVDAGAQGGWIAARRASEEGIPVVLLRPERAAEFIRSARFTADAAEPPISCRARSARGEAWGRLRSLHGVHLIDGDAGVVVIEDQWGKALWRWLPCGRSGMMLLGTDLHRDLIRIRQGDPAKAANRPTEAQWGIAGERPIYLFEDQLDPLHPGVRMADWWIWTLRDALVRHGGVSAGDVLPFGAPGAVIVTGDDDQAPLSDYSGQARKLGRLPVTYFLHPLTKHDAGSLASHSQARAVEWELHPDALDAPDHYGARLHEQSQWFTELVGRRPRLVRNHGYLNDGYWGHAGPWRNEGIIGSSNLPGVDGRVLNGSLLPARLVLDGALTPHWSQLTAFGDGVFFILDWSAETALDKITDYGREIVRSRVPGIIVLNLHPANHEKAAAMHEAAHRLVAELGFSAMTFGAAIDWFDARDRGAEDFPTHGMIPPYAETRNPAPRRVIHPLSRLRYTLARLGLWGCRT